MDGNYVQSIHSLHGFSRVMWCSILATITLLNTITAFSVPANVQTYFPSKQYGNIPQYEVLELTPSEIEELVSNVHSPAIDHLLLPEEYGGAEGELGYYPNYPLYNDYYQEDDNDQIHQLQLLQDYMNEGRDSDKNIDITTTTESPTTQASSTTTTRPVIRRMTKERRGMMEEPIFRPDNARDPQFMYRGRKKRSAPVPPFINAGATNNKMQF